MGIYYMRLFIFLKENQKHIKYTKTEKKMKFLKNIKGEKTEEKNAVFHIMSDLAHFTKSSESIQDRGEK